MKNNWSRTPEQETNRAEMHKLIISHNIRKHTIGHNAPREDSDQPEQILDSPGWKVSSWG